MRRNRKARPRVRAALAAFVAAAAWASPVPGQFHDPAREDSVYLEPSALPKKTRPPVRLLFTLLQEIPLPGPLRSAGPRLTGDRIEIPVADGWVFTPWPLGPEPGVRRGSLSSPGPEHESGWSVGPAGKFRVRALAENRILAEKRCGHCRRGWRRVWKLRVAGQTLAPPLVTDRRVFFGALDNRVYCVKKRNGHRVWATDVGGRVSGPLVLWSAEPALPDEPPAAAILVVPDRGTKILALDLRTGSELASFTLPNPEGKLVGAPVRTPDGKIVAAMQKYAPSEASLVVLRLDPAGSPAVEQPAIPYNGGSSAPGPAPAR